MIRRSFFAKSAIAALSVFLSSNAFALDHCFLDRKANSVLDDRMTVRTPNQVLRDFGRTKKFGEMLDYFEEVDGKLCIVDWDQVRTQFEAASKSETDVARDQDFELRMDDIKEKKRLPLTDVEARRLNQKKREKAELEHTRELAAEGTIELTRNADGSLLIEGKTGLGNRCEQSARLYPSEEGKLRQMNRRSLLLRGVGHTVAGAAAGAASVAGMGFIMDALWSVLAVEPMAYDSTKMLAAGGAALGAALGYREGVKDNRRAKKILEDSESHAGGSQWKVAVSAPCESVAFIHSQAQSLRSGGQITLANDRDPSHAGNASKALQASAGDVQADSRSNSAAASSAR